MVDSESQHVDTLNSAHSSVDAPNDSEKRWSSENFVDNSSDEVGCQKSTLSPVVFQPNDLAIAQQATYNDKHETGHATATSSSEGPC